jgi:hypothetical protein
MKKAQIERWTRGSSWLGSSPGTDKIKMSKEHVIGNLSFNLYQK